jgi:capsular polysaccharide biosynthesis protein
MEANCLQEVLINNNMETITQTIEKQKQLIACLPQLVHCIAEGVLTFHINAAYQIHRVEFNFQKKEEMVMPMLMKDDINCPMNQFLINSDLSSS